MLSDFKNSLKTFIIEYLIRTFVGELYNEAVSEIAANGLDATATSIATQELVDILNR